MIVFAWEDIKAMFNGGSRKRMIGGSSSSPPSSPFSGITNNSDVISGNESHTGKPSEGIFLGTDYVNLW